MSHFFEKSVTFSCILKINVLSLYQEINTNTMKEITLYNYLLWTVDGDATEIDAWNIADQLDINGWSKDELMAFYEKYKNSELENYTEKYDSPDGTYRGLGYYDTVVSFSIDGMNFEIREVNGSYLHDLAVIKQEEILLSKERMVEWAGELKELYNAANSDTELADCADAMADFIDEFLKVYNK